MTSILIKSKYKKEHNVLNLGLPWFNDLLFLSTRIGHRSKGKEEVCNTWCIVSGWISPGGKYRSWTTGGQGWWYHTIWT